MNKEQTQKQIDWYARNLPAMIGHAAGKVIQYNISNIDWCDCISNNPAWYNDTEYRIKPEPQYRPYTREELIKIGPELLGRKIKKRTYLSQTPHIISKYSVWTDNCYINGTTLQGIFDEYVFEDGTPIGVLVE